MYRNILILVVAGFLFSACKGDRASQQEASVEQDAYPSFSIKRGTNIAHWLSQSDRRGDERAAFFTEDDIVFIDSVGFDHIR